MRNQTNSSLNFTSWTTDNLVSSSLMGLFFLIGIPGNIAVIYLIVRDFKKNNFTVHLMLNLAASDILCLITLPGWIYSEFTSINQSTCMLLTTVVYCSIYSSLITVTGLSVYRCLRIRHPQMWTRLDRRQERALFLAGWVLALVCSCPGVLTHYIINGDSKTECERNLNSHWRLIVAALESLFGFVLPLIIILTSYYYLHKKVRQRLVIHRRRLTRLVTQIIIVFLICWAPYHITKLVDIFAKFFGLQQMSSSIGDIAGCLTFINSCVNPFLYAFSSKSLRQQKLTKKQETHVVNMEATSTLV